MEPEERPALVASRLLALVGYAADPPPERPGRHVHHGRILWLVANVSKSVVVDTVIYRIDDPQAG